ncbi:hypothetical protein OIV19_06950 [Brucella sp. HL-2]|nr:hypothetical protein [Brucella sp. HL-2]MCV9907352.1 hypothetical protein [Brucella sp. HL-2]
MNGPLSKLTRVSDKASASDAVMFWTAISIILGVMFSGQVALIIAAVIRMEP